ncbi:hypothetical protein GGS23DRAFT_163552 [Durotheca rogersii]|uniref:uncharacterized protein n=1 Tax=Durotheca rogersii TaxID=419775 RepID=UPI00222110BB|nr:uncharacterized protein GGS23DRAFT_163552 [Durotheca rogersii]KAI5867153.1 hypothetical protein GGS23DRAFT_163552 [Durotheca rogersii]
MSTPRQHAILASTTSTLSCWLGCACDPAATYGEKHGNVGGFFLGAHSNISSMSSSGKIAHLFFVVSLSLTLGLCVFVSVCCFRFFRSTDTKRLQSQTTGIRSIKNGVLWQSICIGGRVYLRCPLRKTKHCNRTASHGRDSNVTCLKSSRGSVSGSQRQRADTRQEVSSSS